MNNEQAHENEEVEAVDMSNITDVFGTDPQKMKDGVWINIEGTEDRLKIAFVPNLKFANAIEKKVQKYLKESKLNDKQISVLKRSQFALEVTSELRLVDWDIVRDGQVVPYSVEKCYEMISASPALDRFVTKTSKDLDEYQKHKRESDVKK